MSLNHIVMASSSEQSQVIIIVVHKWMKSLLLLFFLPGLRHSRVKASSSFVSSIFGCLLSPSKQKIQMTARHERCHPNIPRPLPYFVAMIV
jgi:hypothetical protein